LGIIPFLSDFLKTYDNEKRVSLERLLEAHFTTIKDALLAKNPEVKINMYFNKNTYCTKEKFKQLCINYMTFSLANKAWNSCCNDIKDLSKISLDEILLFYFHYLYTFIHLD
jgi:phosphoenolpyruvate-protein kinase (PTS system EI component)